MKNICYFFISMGITIFVIFAIKYIISGKYETKQEYELHTCVSVKNCDRNIKKDSTLEYKECCNKAGDVELEINVEKYDVRIEKFEISVLNNLQQEKFQITESGENIESYQFEIAENEQEKKISIVLDEKQIVNKNNLVIILRQDIDVYSSDNELVSDSNTVCIPFCIMRENSRNTNELKANYIDTSKTEMKNEENVFKVSLLNTNNSKVLEVKPKEEVKFYVELPTQQESENIVLWCFLNSKQVEIEEMEYLTANIKSDYNSRVLISFIAPEEVGKYEMELFGQFVELKLNRISNFYSIISANRYTLEVKE